MKVVKTHCDSHETVFDVFLRAAKRRKIDARLVEEGRTLIADFSDTTFLQPFVGTHRVQRIPKGSARRHTSTATVAILEEIESDFELDEADLAERFTRGTGNGGQNKNVHDNCVVLKHIPTSIEVRVDSRSQWENRQQARREMARRLSEAAQEAAGAAQNHVRRSQIAGTERAAKGFTWNEQHDVVIDHSSGKRYPMGNFIKGKF